MSAHKRSTVFSQFSSVVAMGFLLWTLSSSTFLDASSCFVERRLNSVKKLSDQTTQKIEMLLLHCIR